jgi:hypothetical protein
MHISEYLKNEPYCPYYPSLRELTGHPNAALFLSQCLIWSMGSQDLEGWFTCSLVEWKTATGLHSNEQATARRRLISQGLIETKRDGHRVLFRALIPEVLEHLQG